MTDIKLFGASWCPACLLIKQTLQDNKVPFDYIDAGVNPQSIEVEGVRSLPSIKISGVLIVNPTISKLKELGVL